MLSAPRFLAAASEQTLSGVGAAPDRTPVMALGAAGSAPGAASAAIAQSASVATPNAVAALKAGSDWHAPSGATVITYSFAKNAGDYLSGQSYAETFKPFSAADQAVTREMLATISAVCNVSFVEVADTAFSHGQVRYGYSDLPMTMGYAGYAFFPGASGDSGNVWLAGTMGSASWDWYRPDLILHETLHAIGLKHPFDGAATLDAQSDLIVNTVMSYSTMAGTRSGWMAEYPREPMVLDIAALQSLYGATSRNGGDTVYDLADARMQSNFHAVWDSGGKDTFDAGRVGHGVFLDLREGASSDIGETVAAQGTFGTGAARTTSSTTYTKTVSIAMGTSIEQAIGSGFDDTIVLGAATRRVDAGAGLDTVVLTGRVDDYSVGTSAGTNFLTRVADGAQLVLSGVERIEFADAALEQAGFASNDNGAYYQQAFRLYLAALDRAPDQGGLIYHTRALESGLTLPQLAGNFIASPEFQQHYGGADNSAFVTLLYHNVLDRSPDAGGLAHWLGVLGRGESTRADVLACFSESPENQANVQAELAGVSAEGMLVPTF